MSMVLQGLMLRLAPCAGAACRVRPQIVRCLMDGMQFGRRISEHRRARGWTSQRALIEAVQRDTVLCKAGISEDFIARLEAGQLVYPFRGRVRRRVLQLSRLMCASPRDLQSYLHAAAIAHLSPGEEEEIKSVRTYLAA